MFDIAVRLEIYVNECYFGPFGFFNIPSNPLDCWRRRYNPYLPIWKLDGMPEWDLWIEYFPWTCNYEEGEGGVIKNSIKREPSNVDDGTKEQPAEGETEPINEPTNLPTADEDPLAEFSKRQEDAITEFHKPDHFITMN